MQDCSLRECLTASRVETSKKKILAKIVVKIIFSVLMLSSVHSNLLVFLTYRENNFCQLSLMLLNVRLTRAMKYQLFITKTRKGRFPAGKAKLVWEAPLRRHIFLKFFVSLGITNSHLFLFYIYLVFFIPLYNL